MITSTPAEIGRLKGKPFLLYGDSVMINGLAEKGLRAQTLKTFDSYWITRLKPTFLNKVRRAREITKTEVVLVKPSE